MLMLMLILIINKIINIDIGMTVSNKTIQK